MQRQVRHEAAQVPDNKQHNRVANAHPKSGQSIFLRGELSPDFLNLLSHLEKYKTS